MRSHEAGVLHAEGYGGPPLYLPATRRRHGAAAAALAASRSAVTTTAGSPSAVSTS